MRTLEASGVGESSRSKATVMFPVRPPILAGPGSNLVAISLLIQAFEKSRPDINLDAPRSMGSAATVRAVADGLITVGLISRPLHDSETGWGLTVLPYARTAVVWGAHPSVQEAGVSTGELVQMFQGAKTRWQDGQEIVLFTREPEDISVQILEQRIPGFREAYQNGHGVKRWTTLHSDREMNRLLAVTPGALGLTDLGSTKVHRSPVKVLQFNGIPPTGPNVGSHRYPLVKTLRFVFRKETLPGQAMAVIQFARSREAEKVLRANGYLLQE